MSYKIGFILSMVFVITFFLFASDMVSIQFIYTDLDAKSVTISQLISKRGNIDNNFISYLEDKYQIDFVSADNYSPLFGDEVTYVIAKEYKPIIMGEKVMNIAISRTTVIGYYN